MALTYVIVQINDQSDFINRKIVVAKDLLKSVIEDCEIKDYKIVSEIKGSDFHGTICLHPFNRLGYDYDIPMLEARFVTTEQGSGIVHCAPSHGPDDFNLCLNNNIKAVETVDDDGKYTKHILNFEGIHIFKANPIVIEKLKNEKNLLANGKLNHSYPHSWRSKAPLVHRATPQWFISMESHKLRDKALKAIDDTEFYPSKGKERLRSMIETRPDWCVSRQRVWGVPLPIFISKSDGKVLVDEEVFENIAAIYEKEGSDCWFSDDPPKFLGSKYKSEDFIKLKEFG
jgi:Isoleucyl-tRNA synthetase